MTRLTLTALVAGTAITLASHVTHAAPQKPVHETFLNVSGMAPSVQFAQAVIVGRYTGKTRPVVRSKPELYATAYQFELMDIVKLHPSLPAPGSLMDILQLGGDQETGTVVERVREAHTQPLVPDHTYVVFLNWNSYFSTMGAVSLRTYWDVTDGTVKCQSDEFIDFNDARPGAATAFLQKLVIEVNGK